MRSALKWLAFLALAWMLPSFAKETTSMTKKVVFETTLGNIEMTLKPDVAPITCENFINLVNAKKYDGTKFHRVIKGFMAQGGDYTNHNGTGGDSFKGGSFKDEFKSDVKFDRPGLLAMANRGPNTNGSQFFLTTVPTPHLNNRHTIFGEITNGMDVLKKIEAAKTGPMDRPLDDIKIIRAYEVAPDAK